MQQTLADDAAYTIGPVQDMKLRWLHSILAERGNISVYCRVRPMIQNDVALWKQHLDRLAVGDFKLKAKLKDLKFDEPPVSIELNGQTGLVLKLFDPATNSYEKGGKFFSYDKIFGPDSS